MAGIKNKWNVFYTGFTDVTNWNENGGNDVLAGFFVSSWSKLSGGSETKQKTKILTSTVFLI